MNNTDSAAASPSTATAEAAGEERIMLVVLGSHGFEPRELRVRPGLIALRIINRSLIRDVRLVIEREDGSVPRQQEAPHRENRWFTKVNLAPGTYFLRVAGIADLQARINVSAGGQ